jgi:hypothetical protein
LISSGRACSTACERSNQRQPRAKLAQPFPVVSPYVAGSHDISCGTCAIPPMSLGCFPRSCVSRIGSEFKICDLSDFAVSPEERTTIPRGTDHHSLRGEHSILRAKVGSPRVPNSQSGAKAGARYRRPDMIDFWVGHMISPAPVSDVSVISREG